MVLTPNKLSVLKDPERFYSTEETAMDIKKELVRKNRYYDVYYYGCRYSYEPFFEKYRGLYDKSTDIKPGFLFYLNNRKDTALSENILILVHGYRSRRKDIYTAMAERFAGEGISVLVYILPFHFCRVPDDDKVKDILEKPKISFVMEMFRQSIIETRLLIRHLKKTQGKRIGLMGFSFGGYCTSLLACLDSDVGFIISMASLGGFSPLAKHIDRSSERLEKHLVKEYLDIISPIEYMPLIGRDRILFVQGFFDVRTPVRDVQRLRKKWGNPRTIWYPCDHLTFIMFNRLTTFFVKRFIWQISGKYYA